MVNRNERSGVEWMEMRIWKLMEVQEEKQTKEDVLYGWKGGLYSLKA
jgi:ABC-type tungstate transport system permease subunit